MKAVSKRSFDWLFRSLRPTRIPFDPAYGLTVENCVPPAYAAYIKILHPMYRDTSILDQRITWDEWARSEGVNQPGYREATEDMTDFSQATLVMSPAMRSDMGKRILWAELADRCGLIFHPELNERSFRLLFPRSWPRCIYGPAEGFLEAEQYRGLIEVLASFTIQQFCYLKMSDHWRVGEKVARVFRGDLREVPEFLHKSAPFRNANHVWPEDRSWCLTSDDDLAFSLLGGSDNLINALSAHAELETIRVTVNTRLDFQADRINNSQRNEVN